MLDEGDPDPDPVSILQTIENEHEDLTDDKRKEIKLIKTELWFLGRFLLGHWECSKSLQVRIRSLLVFAEDLYRSNFDADPSYVLRSIEHFNYFIPINYWESEESLVPVTTPLNHVHMLAYIDNVVQNFKDLLIVRLVKLPDVQSQVESVVKELRALKKFIFFLGEICISTEQIKCWQTFWLHVRLVTTRAAILLYLPCYDRFSHMMQDNLMCSQIVCDDELLKYILKLLSFGSTHVKLYLNKAADEFMDFLLHVHMQLGADSWTSDQNYTFTEQINCLRALLKELPLINDIQDEMRIHFFKRLVTLVIHAGLTVYSGGDWDQKMLLLYGMIRSVKTEICHKIREWVTSHLPKNDKLGFSNCLLASLKEFLSGHSASLASVKDQIEVVHEELKFFEPFIMRLAEQANNKHNELQNLVGRVIDKAYEVEYILDSFAISDVPLTFLRMWLLEIIREIELIKTELTKPKEKNMTSASHATDGELVGFTDVCKTIRDQLVGGSQELDVVSIVGMAGSGKTTLARSFINDDIVVSHFDFFAECRVSQEYTREDLLFSILSSANSGLTDISKRGADILADRLRKTLLPKRYLLIIDDVWAVQAWDDLRLCFPEAKKGSRIILTTRLKEVATYAKCVTEPINLRSMKDSESWLLLQKKVFGEEMCPEELKEVGQNIAFKCNGLPLSIVLVAGLLAKIDKTERCWTRMELSFGERVQDGAKDLVKLSYEDLPNKLKSCFLYFGAFLEDREISVSKLTSLWIAEEFIKNNEDKCLEDTAEDYLSDLIGRNLIMVSKRRSTGKIKACRVHDLMLDFCKEKAKEDNFLLWLKRDRDSNPPRFYSERPMHRRLSFYSNRDDLSEWRPSCSHARSILFRELSDNACSSMRHASFIFGNFKFLRVLDLEVVDVDSFPTELNQLRYLAVQTTKNSIPSSIENLWNLQTFIVKRNGGQVWLPDTFWKLSKLRYVSISDGALFASRGAQESCGGNFLKLDNLETFSSIYVSRVNNMERMVRRTPNLRKLRCVFTDLGRWGKNENRFPVLDSLSQLETLKVVFVGISEVGPSRLNFPENLKKLTLCKFPLPPEEISTIAKLVNLEVLKLRQVAFEMGEWEVRDQEFSQLKLLELENLKLSKWEVSPALGARASASTTASGPSSGGSKPGTVYESRAGVAPPTEGKRREGRGTIWEEYYPLIQPANQYHHHRNGRGSSNYFFHGMFSSDVLCAYRDAVIAYLITAMSMTVLSLTALIFCKQWGIPAQSPLVFLARCIWLVSPAFASFSLRYIADGRLQACNTPSHWNIPPFHHLFKCFPTRAMLRLSLLSYAIPVLCELAAFSFTAATRMVNPFNRSFVQKLEMVFSFNDVDALDSGLVFYVFYISIMGIFWDPLPPKRYDFGLAMGLRPVGCSWFLLAMIQEIGWSGSLFPALEIVFSHSMILAAAITGIIWALWYWPMIIADALGVIPEGSGYAVVETRDFHLLYVLSAFTLLLVGSRIIMCWIQGNSCYIIWSSVVYHATHKLFIISVFGQLTAPLYQKSELFSFFSSEASISVLVTVWFSTCILSQMFRWTNLMPLLTRRARSGSSSRV